jgi:hypothetical protein
MRRPGHQPGASVLAFGADRGRGPRTRTAGRHPDQAPAQGRRRRPGRRHPPARRTRDRGTARRCRPPLWCSAVGGWQVDLLGGELGVHFVPDEGMGPGEQAGGCDKRDGKEQVSRVRPLPFAAAPFWAATRGGLAAPPGTLVAGCPTSGCGCAIVMRPAGVACLLSPGRAVRRGWTEGSHRRARSTQPGGY